MNQEEFDAKLNKVYQALPPSKKRLWLIWLQAYAADRMGRATPEQKAFLARVRFEQVVRSN